MVKKEKEENIEQHYLNLKIILTEMYGVCNTTFKDNELLQMRYQKLFEIGCKSLNTIENKLKEGNLNGSKT